MHSLRRQGGAFAFLAMVWFSKACGGEDRPAGSLVVRPPNEVEFTAVVNTKPFDSGLDMPGYHAIVWSGGRMAHAALLKADVSDTQVLEALKSLGASPGDNLGMAVWDERQNMNNRAADTVIAGPAVHVLLRLPSRNELVPLVSVLQDTGGRGIEMRFGGNAANIPKWKSGCIVCLFSCPGSKIGNARYTVRDYTNATTRFHAKREALPADGTRIGVVLRLTPPSPAKK